jgi:hypothetical protein
MITTIQHTCCFLSKLAIWEIKNHILGNTNWNHDRYNRFKSLWHKREQRDSRRRQHYHENESRCTCFPSRKPADGSPLALQIVQQGLLGTNFSRTATRCFSQMRPIGRFYKMVLVEMLRMLWKSAGLFQVERAVMFSTFFCHDLNICHSRVM